MIKPEISVLIDVSRKASKSLKRDYFELENLQTSTKSVGIFCQKAGQQAFKKMHESIAKYYPKARMFTSLSELKAEEFKGYAMLISPLEGVKNFERSLPFFVTSITLLHKNGEKITPEQCVLNFPALAEIYYAEKGGGAFVENHASNFSGSTSRIRVSSKAQLNDALVITNLAGLDAGKKFSSNIRVFESSAYGAAMVARGKADICLLNASSPSSYAFELLINESGGYCTFRDGFLYGCNDLLSGKI